MTAGGAFRRAAGIAALACTGCTVNYYHKVVQPTPAAPEVPKDAPKQPPGPVTAACTLDWRGFNPSGWTVAAVTAWATSHPGGCGKPELVFHPVGGPVDWKGSPSATMGDTVRAAVTETVTTGSATVQRVHLFTGPEPRPTAQPVRWRTLVILGGRGPRGREGPPGKDGKDAEPGRDRWFGYPSEQAPDTQAKPPQGQDRDARGGGFKAAKAIPPALAGGGIVYGLMYLNLLSAPGAQPARPVRRREPDKDDGSDAAELVAPGGDSGGDPRVRVRASGFE